MTAFTVYDTSDKKNPVVAKEYKFEGYYFQARMYEKHVYFVVQHGLEYRQEYPTPMVVVDDVKIPMPVEDISYFPVPYDTVQFLTTHTIDLETLSDTVNSKSVATKWGSQLYMSTENLYLTYTENINSWEISQEITMKLLEPQLTAEDRTLVQKIKNTDNDVLTPAEKKGKIFHLYQRYIQFMDSEEQQALSEKVEEETKKQLEMYEALQYTVIHKLHVDNGDLNVVATGKVPGTINNQFAIDEYKGELRIATTIRGNQWWVPWRNIAEVSVQEPSMGTGDSTVAVTNKAVAEKIIPDDRIIQPRSDSTNNENVLDEKLHIAGSLKNLALGESIFATRFMGDRLYMVTFEQVDPFFVIDLSTPTNPKELGQLKIPGFSRYLHPYDNNIIIGIGRDATTDGSQRGLKISLFDVSDVANPKEVAKFIAKDKYSQSSAEWEHKAFLFSKEKNLLVIPAYNYDYNKLGSGKENYNGAMVFKIAPTEITLRGIIDHSVSQQYYGPMVERSLYIEDLLYTKSPGLLRINALEDLSSVKKVELTGKNAEGIYPIY